MSLFRLSLCVVPIATLLACGTPQAARDSAANTAALAGALNTEMRAYREVQRQVAALRIKSIGRQEARLMKDDVELKFENTLRRASGIPDDADLRKQIEAVATSLEERDRQLLADQEKLAKLLERLSVPVPDVSQSLVKVEQSLTVLAEELSTEERLRAMQSFVDELRETVKRNREQAVVAEPAPPKDDPT